MDLSASYLERGRDNFRLNDIDPDAERFVHGDAMEFLRDTRTRYGVIYLNPPSYSRSHRMDTDFDIKRDHAKLIGAAMACLEPSGTLFFSTHARDFALDPRLSDRFDTQDISHQSVPEDYKRSPHKAYRIAMPTGS